MIIVIGLLLNENVIANGNRDPCVKVRFETMVVNTTCVYIVILCYLSVIVSGTKKKTKSTTNVYWYNWIQCLNVKYL